MKTGMPVMMPWGSVRRWQLPNQHYYTAWRQHWEGVCARFTTWWRWMPQMCKQASPTQPVPVGLRLRTFTNRCAKLPYGSTTGHSRSADRCDLLKQPAHLHLYLPAGVAGLESVSMNISKDFLTLLVLDKRMYIESHC